MAAAVGIKGQLAVCGVYKDCFEVERVIKQKLRVCKRGGVATTGNGFCLQRIAAPGSLEEEHGGVVREDGDFGSS